MITEAKKAWRFVVDRITRVSGRSLRPTGAGRVVLLLAFAVGFAAMNTGNNLLFFGWGLVLSSIIISGILSESTLQAASATPLAPVARTEDRNALEIGLVMSLISARIALWPVGSTQAVTTSNRPSNAPDTAITKPANRPYCARREKPGRRFLGGAISAYAPIRR